MLIFLILIKNRFNIHREIICINQNIITINISTNDMYKDYMNNLNTRRLSIKATYN